MSAEELLQLRSRVMMLQDALEQNDAIIDNALDFMEDDGAYRGRTHVELCTELHNLRLILQGRGL